MIYPCTNSDSVGTHLSISHTLRMSQPHGEQHGLFHITTNTYRRIPWCTESGVPQLIIDNLFMTRNVHQARVFAFCILPDHVHSIVSPGERGISQFMQSWKSHTSRDVRNFASSAAESHGFPLQGRSISTVGESHGSRLQQEQMEDFGLWQKSFYDERIRNEKQYINALQYVRINAYKHGLSPTPQAWPWCSTHFMDRMDSID